LVSFLLVIIGAIQVHLVNMILKKQSNPSARWNESANSWSIGTADEYQWYHEKTKTSSPWMTFDEALIWIKEYDNQRHRSNKV
jgi:hypothetical protein